MTPSASPAAGPAPAGAAAEPGFGFHLVSMPWHGLGMAPLALSQVRGTLARTHPRIPVTEHFANIGFAEYLLAATGGRITPQHYQDVADNGIPLGLGDWVFAGVLYDPDWGDAAMREFAARSGADISAAREMRALAGAFADRLASAIAAARPGAVGFTTTFMQSVPALALARLVKEKSPGTAIIFGGANCDGPMGAALHRNHPFVDYVVRGEAELVLPLLVDRILAGTGAAGLDGVCWRDDGAPVANPQRSPLVPADLVADVDYDAWHAAFTASPVREYVSPWLVIEGSRGCWWGAKHHCTFCGLNDATIEFRARPADRFMAELERVVTRYRILDIITSDNIMSPDHLRDLVPSLARSGWDLRIHYELKANVTEELIAQLAAAGVVMVQFGIESFSSRVLKIMRKGVTGATAVRVLRDAQEYGVSVSWNYLYGFPGENDDDYTSVISQLPALAHLQPPQLGAGSRIGLQRFAPYFERPDLGFPDRRPADFYRHVYDLPPSELQDLAYYFDCPDSGIGGGVEEELNQALAAWTRAYPASFLTSEASQDSLVLTDARPGWPQRRIELRGWRRAAYDALRRPRTEDSLRTRLAGEGLDPGGGEIRLWLAAQLEQGLVFRDETSWVALATGRAHAKLAAPR